MNRKELERQRRISSSAGPMVCVCVWARVRVNTHSFKRQTFICWYMVCYCARELYSTSAHTRALRSLVCPVLDSAATATNHKQKQNQNQKSERNKNTQIETIPWVNGSHSMLITYFNCKRQIYNIIFLFSKWILRENRFTFAYCRMCVHLADT